MGQSLTARSLLRATQVATNILDRTSVGSSRIFRNFEEPLFSNLLLESDALSVILREYIFRKSVRASTARPYSCF